MDVRHATCDVRYPAMVLGFFVGTRLRYVWDVRETGNWRIGCAERRGVRRMQLSGCRNAPTQNSRQSLVTSRAWRPVADVLLTTDEQAVQSNSRLYQTAVGTSGEELEHPEPPG